MKIGADDYLAKPFHLPELSMRIYALVRRRQFSGGNVLHSNGIEIDLLSKEVTAGNKPVILTKTEYDLLLYFIGNKNKVVSKGALAEHLNGDLADMFDNYDFLYSHIKNLRAKLFEATSCDYIKTIYGIGYKWPE